MGFSLACKDVGVDCNFVAKGKNVADMMQNGAMHAKKVHGYTDKQLNSMDMVSKMHPFIKCTC